MNIVKELRKKKGVQQKELALVIGVAQPTVSEWEANKKDPSGDRLKKLAEFFGVDELTILGKDVSGESKPLSESEQILQDQIRKLTTPKTEEARIISGGIDKMPPEDRERALNMMKLMFKEYADYFERNEADDDDR